MGTSLRSGLLVLGLVVIGCSGGESPLPDAGRDAGDSDSPDLLEDALSDLIPETGTGELPDALTRDLGPREDIEPGAFGAPCSSNRDCLSNTCVEGPTGFVCSQYCVTECPDGWLCRTTTMGTDIVSVCIPEGVNLCKPCRIDSQCGDGVCLDLDEGKYCSRSCESVDCPVGFDCEEMEVGEQGVRMMQCLPSNGTCSCRVANAEEERPCIRQNEFGTCLGFERCAPESGWIGCSAGDPATETCNGIDDDCNGVADDGLLPPLEACTNDVPDVGSCPGTWVCNGESGWGCVGPLPVAEECNYRDDDCDGLTDEAFKDEAGRYTSMEHCGVCNNACEGRIPFAKTVVCNGNKEVPGCEVEECEPGYARSGPQACVPRVTNLCVPCVDDENCGFEGDRCLPIGSGMFCARDCSEGAPLGTSCPAGYTCADGGGDSFQCVPISGTCECTLSNQGMQRLCEQRNAFGACSGVETCDAALGWMGCTARTPAPEKCDGVDNNCNGLVDDEPPPPVEPCERTWTDPLDDTVYTCSAPWKCAETTGGKGWVCEAREPGPEECNYRDDNCDGLIDENFKVPGTDKYGDLLHCGACGVSCVGLVPNAVMFCNGLLERPSCEVQSCAPGYWKSSVLSCSPLPDTLCSECSSDAGCQVPGDACLALGAQVKTYCLWDCSPNSLHPEDSEGSRCPEGFSCRETSDAGQPFFRCVPDSGSCDCLARDAGRERLCARENAFGRCLGSELCDPGRGWLDCDARLPAAETCNGVDDNCNGLVDELFPAKGAACAAGLGICRREGTLVCNTEGTGVRCSVEPGEPRDELCNGLDDNCNRLVDEDWPDKGKVCMLGDGECLAFGTLVCAADGLDLECDAIPGEPQVERCNGRDDNCNGLIDEDFTELGRTCAVGTGECRRNGAFVCSADGLGVACNVSGGSASPELCNGLDDNCDGAIDEDFPNVGRICMVGQGECFAVGVVQCSPDGMGEVCNAVAGTPTTELCNGLDDNCNGVIDDLWPDKGKVCFDGIGECRAAGVFVCAAGGLTLECNAVAGIPVAEQCNGRDDNCNGQIDESFPDLGRPCSAGVGECRRNGVFVCSPDGLAVVCDAEADVPTVEFCNGRDDNCNGLIDEDFPELGRTCAVGTGECRRSGAFVCSANGLGIDCNAEAGLPVPELCNGLDDNCDGQIDEDFPNVGRICTVGQGECFAVGVVKCSTDGTGEVCNAVAGTPTAELCNGLDDNCNGVIDDPFPDKGKVCFAGVGECRAAGVFVCSGNGSSLECNAVAGTPVAELCNGRDDNCNGQIDESFPNVGQFCSAGVGECRRNGVVVCSGNGLAVECNAVAASPATELCNGLDDDCNGVIDDTFPDKGKVCFSGIGECRSAGVFVCSGNGLSLECDAVAGTPVTELCNGRDDNCNGQIDESFPDLGRVCSAGVGECRSSGVFVCTGNGLAVECDAVAGTPTAELCNGLDDNCNGVIDDPFPDKGKVCFDGVGECRAAGVFVCSGNGSFLECNAVAGTPVAEVCNGLDDNCNGQVDELWPDKGQVCSLGLGQCRREGVLNCSGDGSGLDCSADPGAPAPELCNGLDDNCNGSTDELWPLKGTVCTVGLGQCVASGVFECNPAQDGILCNASEGAPHTEVCDYLDNDCDGVTDNGFLIGGKYSLDTNCGNCFTDCTVIYNRPNAFGLCDSSGVPICRMYCQANHFDLNLVPDDGCEFFLDPDAIYVSKADTQADDLPGCGRGPVGTGTNHRPCRTIAAGMAEAVATVRGKVLVADGLYEETVTLQNGKNLLGGYRADTWERNLGATLTVIRGNTASGQHKKSVIASGINISTVFEGFLVYGEVNFNPGGNSYALWASNCTSAFTVRNNTFFGGAGGNGTAGGSGAHAIGGTSGNVGQDMITTTTASQSTCQGLSSTPGNQGVFGDGGVRLCNGLGVNGGAGAGAQCPSQNSQQPSGANGSSAGGGGTAGSGGVGGRDRYSSNCSTFSTGGYTATGMPGTDGGQGAHGTAGSGCTVDGSTGSISGGEWLGNAGGNALAGAAGGGGGGGGAGGGADITGTCDVNNIQDSLGGSGGGGGSGGCGGESGSGGSAGGGAFTIFITSTAPTSNRPTITSNSIQPGAGGRGGDGGLGGAGGLGGNGGNGGNVGNPFGYAMGQGGRGGQGGNGGAGGGGGGGCGGVSYGIYVHNGSGTPPYAGQNTFRPGGTGGAGGAGGPSLGNSGTPGVAGDAADFLF